MYDIISIKTGQPEFDNFFPLIKSFLEKDTMDIVIDDRKIRGYRSPDSKAIWLLDFSDMLRGMKYFEKDLKSTINHFAETQTYNGRIFDYFTIFPEKLPCQNLIGFPLLNLLGWMPIKFVTFQGIEFINMFTTNTTLEPFQGTTTISSGLVK